MFRVMGTAVGPSTAGPVCASAVFSSSPAPRAPELMLTPRRKPRRENPLVGFGLSESGLFGSFTKRPSFHGNQQFIRLIVDRTGSGCLLGVMLTIPWHTDWPMR